MVSQVKIVFNNTNNNNNNNRIFGLNILCIFQVTIINIIIIIAKPRKRVYKQYRGTKTNQIQIIK